MRRASWTGIAWVLAMGCRPSADPTAPAAAVTDATSPRATAPVDVPARTAASTTPRYRTVLSIPCAIVGGRAVTCILETGGFPQWRRRTLGEEFGPDDAFVHIEEADGRICGLVRPSGKVLCWDLPKGQREQQGEPPVTVQPVDGVVAVALMEKATCAVKEAGDVWCWGSNASGQLGDGSREPRPSPVAVALPDRAIDIEARYDRACALLVTGEVHCWGGNDTAGDPRRLRPAKIDGLAAVASLESVQSARLLDGGWGTWRTLDHVPHRGFTSAETTTEIREHVAGDTCWLEDDALWCTTGRDDEPERLLDEVVELDSDHAAYCTRRKDGSVWCLGRRLPLMNRPPEVPADEPTQVPGLARVEQVAILPNGACALHDEGQVSCWGLAPVPHAVDQDPSFVGRPQRVSLPAKATSIVATREGACALADGQAHCWGTDGQPRRLGRATRLDTQLGLPCAIFEGKWTCSSNDRSWQHAEHAPNAPARYRELPAPPAGFVQGFDTRCSRVRGRLVCEHPRDELQCPSAGQPDAPCTVGAREEAMKIDLRPAVRVGPDDEILVGGGGACVLTPARRWSCASFEDTWARFSAVGIEPQTNVVDAAAGMSTACVVVEGGEVRCWGRIDDPYPFTPGRADPGIRDARSVHVGNTFACAVREDGTLWCWGGWRYGQRGTGGESWHVSWRPIRIESLDRAATSRP